MVHGLLCIWRENWGCAGTARSFGIGAMVLQLFAFGLAISFGFAAASLMRWIYVLLTGEMLALRHLQQPGVAQPIRALAVVAGGPDIMLNWGLGLWKQQKLAGAAIVALSLGWSFMLGVVILTKVFGFS